MNKPNDALLALAEPPSIRSGILQTRKMRWWYEALADYMIANPSATQREMSLHFGRAEPTISTVVNTDAFKAYFRQRRTQHAEKLDTAVREKLFRVADSSLDHLLGALEKKRDSIPIETLQRTADTALKNLGYGAGAPSSNNVNVSVSAPPATVNVAVSLDDLERARAALRRNQMTTIDNDPSGGMGPSAIMETAPAGGATEDKQLDLPLEPKDPG